MNQEQALKQAETFIYCDCNHGDIIELAREHGLKYKLKSDGFLAAGYRSKLEQQLIEILAKEYTTEVGK